MIVIFEGINFDAENVCKGYKNAKDFYKKAKRQYFPNDEQQEVKMSRIYQLCKEALSLPEEEAEVTEPTVEEPAPEIP